MQDLNTKLKSASKDTLAAIGALTWKNLSQFYFSNKQGELLYSIKEKSFDKTDKKEEPTTLDEYQKEPLTGAYSYCKNYNLYVVKDDKVYLMYRAQDLNGTSRIGMAISEDGLHFKKMEEPILFPDNDDMKVYEWNYKKSEAEQTNSEDCYFCYFDGVEDPRVVQSNTGEYFMTYTAYDGKTARLSLASSKDLKTWTKHGLVLKDEKYKDLWSKAGAIVSKLEGHKMVATQINGKYWMYFGDTNLFMATSAISTTGLVTVSLYDSYTIVGQIIIMLLVQIGGIGYMTFTSFILLCSSSVFNHLSNARI